MAHTFPAVSPFRDTPASPSDAECHPSSFPPSRPLPPLPCPSHTVSNDDEDSYLAVSRVAPDREEGGEGFWGVGGRSAGRCWCLAAFLVVSVLLNVGLLAFTTHRELGAYLADPSQDTTTTTTTTSTGSPPTPWQDLPPPGLGEAPACMPCDLLSGLEGEGQGRGGWGAGLTVVPLSGNPARLCCRPHASYIARLLSLLTRIPKDHHPLKLEDASPSRSSAPPSPPPPRCEGARPAAHLLVLPRGNGGLQLDTPPSGLSQCLEVRADGVSIVVGGLYYVYSHFTLKPPTAASSTAAIAVGQPFPAAAVHSLVSIDAKGRSRTLLSSSTQALTRAPDLQALRPSVLAGQVRLQPGDKLRVRLDNAVLFDHNITKFFGLYKMD